MYVFVCARTPLHACVCVCMCVCVCVCVCVGVGVCMWVCGVVCVDLCVPARSDVYSVHTTVGPALLMTPMVRSFRILERRGKIYPSRVTWPSVSWMRCCIHACVYTSVRRHIKDGTYMCIHVSVCIALHTHFRECVRGREGAYTGLMTLRVSSPCTSFDFWLWEGTGVFTLQRSHGHTVS
jgi:hypothetical protein